jgi:hypothetical protein
MRPGIQHVLAVGLALTGPGAAAALTSAAAANGEPIWLTARSLDGAWTSSHPVVRVCENPAVIEAAADLLGPACPPLICTYGRPSQAAWVLLARLADGGTQLLVTADRDASGRQFVRELLGLPGAREWCPEAEGTFEEARLDALLRDLAEGSK